MYKDIVVVNSLIHKTSKIRPVTGFEFAKEMNSCVLLGQEFLEAAKCYPILFARSGDTVTPVVLLGIQSNSFIGDDGKWEAETYIPAYIRRFPYILAEGVSPDGSLTVCIDAGYLASEDEEGERLFTDEGARAPALDKAVEFLTLYQNQFEATKAFVSHIGGLDIFKAMDANITLADGKAFTLRNFLTIDEQAIYKLVDEEIVKLVRQGYMPWIYAHLYSVTNFGRILNRVGNVVKEENR